MTEVNRRPWEPHANNIEKILSRGYLAPGYDISGRIVWVPPASTQEKTPSRMDILREK